MKKRVLQYLNSPITGGPLHIKGNAVWEKGEVHTGTLEDDAGNEFEIIKYIPRLVARQNYSHSWGELWVETGAMLRDSKTGIPMHKNFVHGHYDRSARYDNTSGASNFGFEWPEDLTGQHILEIGPGTGNMTEVLLQTGAHLTCVDMSHAIDTFPEDWLTHPNLDVIQADITTGAINTTFDRIWFFQVLQHTPKPPETLKQVATFLKPGGELAFTSYYGDGAWDDWYRPITKNIPDRLAWHVVRLYTKPITRLKYFVRAWNLPGAHYMRRLLDFADPRDIYWRVKHGELTNTIFSQALEASNNEEELFKHIIVNTYDAVTPEYVNCATHEQAKTWSEAAGLVNIKVWGENGVRVRAWAPKAT